MPFLGSHETANRIYIISLSMLNARDYLEKLLDAAQQEDVKILEDTEREVRRSFYREVHRLVRPAFLLLTLTLFTRPLCDKVEPDSRGSQIRARRGHHTFEYTRGRSF